MAANNDKAYKEALKQLDNMINKQKALGKSTEALNNSWNAIASEIFKMDGAQFFKNVEKSPAQLKAMGKEIQQLEETFVNLGEEFSKSLSQDDKIKKIQKSLKGVGDEFKLSASKLNSEMKSNFNTVLQGLDKDLMKIIKNEKDLEDALKGKKKLTDEQIKKLKEIKGFQDLETKHQKLTEDFNKKMEDRLKVFKKYNSEISLMSKEAISNVMSQMAEGKDLPEILKTANTEERKFLAALSENPAMLNEINKGMDTIPSKIKEIEEEAGKMNKQFSLGKSILGALGSAASGLGSIIRKDWISSMTKFDSVLNDVQKETGINMDANAEGFARLQTNVAQFGMSIEQAGKMMGAMGQELQTTDFSVLSKAAQDFSMIEGATGAASEDITTIAGELMRAGEGSEQVKDFMQGADQMARQFGVSSKKALGDISKNIKKMRTMGFVGGEESLKKMVMTANRLRMNVDEIFDVAKRARTIEGAMDMAAELQLAGGSFSNINPMELLSAARKGPEELQKILTGMGKDVGHWVTDMNGNKKYQFDPVDVDRLQMVADATGQSLDSIQNMIQKNAEDTEKLNPFQGMIDGVEDADKELVKSGLSQMLKVGKDGKIEIDASSDMAKRMGVDSMEDLQAMSGQQLKEKMAADAATLEEENKRNQSLKQSFDNFLNALMSVFSFFQPALEFLTKVMQEVTSVFTTVMGWLPGWGKVLLGGLMLFGALFSTSVGAFITQGIGGFLKGVGSFAKSSFDLIKQVMTGKGGEALGGLGGKIKEKFMGGGGTKDLAESGLKTGGDVAGQKNMTPQAGAGIKGFFTGLSEGIQSFGKVDMGAIAKFALSLLIIGGAIIGFGYAMATIGGEAGIGQMVTAGASLGMLMLAVWGLSVIAKSVDMGGVLKGALAMAIVGAALVPFAFAAQMLTGVDLMSVLGALGILALVVVALIGLGALLMTPIVGWLLMAGIAALIAIGAGLLLAGTGMLAASVAMEKLAGIDWAGFAGMGDALGAVVPGLMAFSLAAMMFMNPLTLLGIIFMVGALTSLAAIMAPLAQSLTLGADSLDRFASGLEKLSAAADKLSLDKLEKLKELSDSMANAGAGAAAVAAMANAGNNNGGGGGKGGDGEVRKIEVNVKMNGRDMQNFIVKDTAIIK